MRLLTLLSWTTPIALTVVGCTRDNPAFDDCDGPDRCLADESGTGGDGDGDPGDGDGAPGDGDGAPGDGDGDGDGDPGDGDGDPGDGDGDPNMLPTCPETKKVELAIVKDTFLVAAPAEGGLCLVSWDLDLWEPKLANNQFPCQELNFGKAEFHWVCTSPECSSMWLGRFNVGGYAEQAPRVTSAQVEFWSLVDNGEANLASLYALEVPHEIFGPCNDWNASEGWGHPAVECATTWKYAASPNPWQLDALFGNAVALGAAPVPAAQKTEHKVIIPIANEVVEGWLVNDPLHLGVVLRSQAWTPTEFMLMAQESTKPPRLILDICSEL